MGQSGFGVRVGASELAPHASSWRDLGFLSLPGDNHTVSSVRGNHAGFVRDPKLHRLLSEVMCWDPRRPCEAEWGVHICPLACPEVVGILSLPVNKHQALLWAEWCLPRR